MSRDLRPAFSLLREFEGFHLKPYRCPAGIPTIGIGTTRYPNGKLVKMEDPEIDIDQAYDYLLHHLKQDCFLLEKFLRGNKLTMNDNQFSALIAFAYNLGIGPVITTGRSLCDALKTGSREKIKEAFLLYTKARVKGEVVTMTGLLRRRKAEIKLYFS
jgi:lysozyme